MARIVEGDLLPTLVFPSTGERLEPVCSYWQRQEFRHVNDYGFGSSPYELITPENTIKAFEVSRTVLGKTRSVVFLSEQKAIEFAAREQGTVAVVQLDETTGKIVPTVQDTTEMTEQAEAHQAARDAEDEKDPPCGKCVACLEPSDGVPEPVAEEQTEKTSRVSNHCSACGERYVTKRVGEGRVDVVCPRGCETGGAL